MNAKLPEDLEGPPTVTIADMRDGETCYTVPWAMMADDDRNLWLRPDYSAEKEPRGTVKMRIKRTRNGFHVWPTPGRQYTPETPRSFIESIDGIPVVKLKG